MDNSVTALLRGYSDAAWHFAITTTIVSTFLALAMEAFLRIGVRRIFHQIVFAEELRTIARFLPDLRDALYPGSDDNSPFPPSRFPFPSTWLKVKSITVRLSALRHELRTVGVFPGVYSLRPSQLFAQLSAALQNASEACPIPKMVLFIAQVGFASRSEAKEALYLTDPAAGENDRSIYLRGRLAVAIERAVDAIQVRFMRVVQAWRVLSYFSVAYLGGVLLLYSSVADTERLNSDPAYVGLLIMYSSGVAVLAPALHEALTNFGRR